MPKVDSEILMLMLTTQSISLSLSVFPTPPPPSVHPSTTTAYRVNINIYTRLSVLFILMFGLVLPFRSLALGLCPHLWLSEIAYTPH